LFVLDAAAAVQALLSVEGLDPLRERGMLAPPLFWSEVTSVLHELKWRGSISDELAAIAIDRLGTAPVARRAPADLQRRAWGIANQLGWAKTYDAEYVALAQALKCALVTTDGQLARGVRNLIEVLSPADI
jgi:predicted nucleic acid-binding protein